MPLLGFTAFLNPNLPVVSPTGGLKYKGTTGFITCYSNLRFGADGVEYLNNIGLANNFSYSIGNWLESGDASNVWIEYTITGGTPGTLNGHDPGSGRLQMNVDRDFGHVKTIFGMGDVTFTLDFYNAEAGGNLLDSVSYTLRANVETL